MMGNSQFFEELRVADISVLSGVRPFGRSADQRLRGRKNCGLLYLWEGEATFYTEDGEQTVAPVGSVVFLPKGKRYKMTYTAERTVFVLVNFELLGKNGEDAVLFPDITVPAREDATNRIAKTMMNFELCSTSKNAEATLRKKELMYRLLGSICTSAICRWTQKDMDPKIAAGVRLLEQTYLENISIAEYAEASHISVNLFRRSFQKQFGMSPLKYRNHLRIERARELLCEGDITVAEVAYASGFENIGYFCRYYKQLTGQTPSETRNKRQYP